MRIGEKGGGVSDEDALQKAAEEKLSQEHELSMTRTLAAATLAALCIAAFSLYSCEKVKDTTDVQKASIESEKAHAEAMKAMWDHQPVSVVDAGRP